MHGDQLTVSLDTVRRLVDEQFPEWRELSLREVVSEGTDNTIVRIGDERVGRFPLRPQDVPQARASLESEASAQRELAECSPVPIPIAVAIGTPGHGYPLPWAVHTWLPGRSATVDDPGRSLAFAGDLATFITCLRAADTRGRSFAGTGRGGHLPDHDAWMEVCFERSGDALDVRRLRLLWRALRDLPRGGPDVMSHKDLIPGNVLVRDGRLIGVLDGGGFGPADPALDLVAAWHLLDAEPRAELKRLLACDDVEWARGMAWAFQQAMGLVWYYVESNPAMSRLGSRTLDRILTEA
jgi:aminoglycoside phosphotransferase (APT) family kinase protein